MILFFAPYPSEDRLNDGMFRRIKEIDTLFEGRKRLYIQPENNFDDDYRVPPSQRIDEFCSVQTLDFRLSSHNIYFAQLIEESDFVYAHTIVHSARFITPFLETGKVICDAHGVATEEWAMSGYNSCSRFWNSLEGLIINDAARIIVVTKAMENFYREKYKVTHDRFIHIPIATHNPSPPKPKQQQEAVRVIYAGGTHPWQNVDLMLDVAQDFPGEAEFTFLSNDIKTFQEKISKHTIKHKVAIQSVAPEDIDSWYAKADLGFVLRNDDPVNNVAFPTKLVEYMYNGVIPIIKSNKLGDITNYGLEVVSLEQFLSGNIPNHAERAQMAKKNLSIFSIIRDEYKKGTVDLLTASQGLKAFPKKQISSQQYPTFIRNSVYPLFFASSYIVDNVRYSQPLDCAEHPETLTLEVENPGLFSMLAIDLSGRCFVSSEPIAVFFGEAEVISRPCRNLQDFEKTQWGDIIYKSGWIYFECPDMVTHRVEIKFKFKLYDKEILSLNSLKNNTKLIKRMWDTLRTQGPAEFRRKAIRKLRISLPEPMKRVLRVGRNIVQWRDAMRDRRVGSFDTTSIDILFQVENFLAGGLENVVLDLMETFRKNGLNVALLVLGQPGSAADQARELGFSVYAQPYSDDSYADLLKKVAPKLVFSHYSTHGAAKCAAADIPFVQVIHNAYMWFDAAQLEDFQSAIKHTTLFIAVSEWAKEYSVKRLGMPEEKCIVIPNGINMSRFRQDELRVQGRILRNELGYTDDDIVMLSVAGVTYQKNPLGLVKAFHAAMSRIPKAKLALLGPVYVNSIEQEIRQYIAENNLQERIRYLGKSPAPETYLAMADMFIHGAFFEGGQLSLLEALASNLPVISTDIGFCRHFRNSSGVYLADAPVDLLSYHGSVTELVAPPEHIEAFADVIAHGYSERAKPDLPDELLDLMDRQASYAAYVKIIMAVLNHEAIPPQNTFSLWTEYLASPTKS